MISVFLFLLYLQQAPFLFTELKPFVLDDKPGKYFSFTIVREPISQELYVVQGADNETLRIFNSQGRVIVEHWMPEMMSIRRTFQFNDRLYCFAGKLYRLDLATLRVDSTDLRRADYYAISWATRNQKELLLANYVGGVDIYDFETLKLKHEISSGGDERFDPALLYGDVVVYQTKRNELQAYDLSKQKILWTFNTGKQAAYLLGIKVGTFEDFFSTYKLMEQDGEMYVVATTSVGNLLKFRLRDAELVVKKERFKGKGNNAGLIARSIFVDMNNDGILDLVGPSVDHRVYCLNGKDLSIIWEYDTGFENQGGCAVQDVNGDGVPDVFAVNDKMKLSIIDGKRGKRIQEVVLEEGVGKRKGFVIVGTKNSEVALADLNGNGLLDVIVEGGGNRIRIFELGGVTVPKNAIVWIPGR